MTTRRKRRSVSREPATKTKLRVNREWFRLLVENERLAKKRGKTPLTDPEMTEEMTRLFPDKKGKTTLTRVSMMRCCYNNGTGMFANMEEAGDPVSYAYDEDGKQIPPRRRTAKKVTKKKADPEKTVAKKRRGKKTVRTRRGVAPK